MPKEQFMDLSTRKEPFGRLKVIRQHPERRHGHVRWVCKCLCGNEVIVSGASLTSGNTTSCGCVHSELLAKRNHDEARHGMSGTPEYNTWATMIDRCHNPLSAAYKRYGGRGITVTPVWRCFEIFYRDMGPRPKGRSIERVDNDLGYTKENCKWGTRREQSQNQSTTVRTLIVEDDIEKLVSVPTLADEFGLSRGTVKRRLQQGWSLIDALLTDAKDSKLYPRGSYTISPETDEVLHVFHSQEEAEAAGYPA